jgi:RNA polymerase sigma-70 factor, ECF subfamily
MSIVMKAEAPRSLFWLRAKALPANLADSREFVFRCALAVCGEPHGAEDVTQEVLLLLLKHAQTVAETEHPEAWIRKVTVRCATRYLKRERRACAATTGQRQLLFSPDQVAVYEVLRQMAPEQRALLGMAIHQGLSHREIAEVLEIPEGTVASRLSTAKSEFRKRWQG